MPQTRPRRGLLQLLADRRGSTAVTVGFGALVLFGTFAVATDASVLYSARRGAQNAADGAASAGALALAVSGAEPARRAALDAASRRGFAQAAHGATTVTVNIPPSGDLQVANPAAVEVVVRQQQRMTAAGLFLAAAPAVEARAVATLRAGADVCVLALTGQVWSGGTATATTSDCVIATNRRDAAGVTTSAGAGDAIGAARSADAPCPGCASSRVPLTRPLERGQLPTPDPFAHLLAKAMPRADRGCLTPAHEAETTLPPHEASGGRVLCGDLDVSGNRTLNLAPGTYYIFNGSFRIEEGGIVRCPTCAGDQGVAIVLTGDPGRIGGIHISPGSDVRLRAARAAADPDFDGVLFYRDRRGAPGDADNPPIALDGAARMELAGGLYFPSAHVRLNAHAGASACTVVVAASVEFTGTAGIGGCGAVGTRVPQTRIVTTHQ